MGDDKGEKDEKRAKKEAKQREKDEKKALLREIRDGLEALTRDQKALRAEVARLSSRLSLHLSSSLGETRTDEPIAQILSFLDRLSSLEAAGEIAFGAWIESCEDDRLRGGLRTIQMRESIHARLLADRIKALGGSIGWSGGHDQTLAILELLGSSVLRDDEKLRELVSLYPDIDSTLAPLLGMAERLGADHETRALLETIAADERSTLEFLHAEHARIERRLETCA